MSHARQRDTIDCAPLSTKYEKIIWSQHGHQLILLNKALGITIVQPLSRTIAYKLSLVSITNDKANK